VYYQLLIMCVWTCECMVWVSAGTGLVLEHLTCYKSYRFEYESKQDVESHELFNKCWPHTDTARRCIPGMKWCLCFVIGSSYSYIRFLCLAILIAFGFYFLASFNPSSSSSWQKLNLQSFFSVSVTLLKGLVIVFMPSSAVSGRRHCVPGRPCVCTCVRGTVKNVKLNSKKLLNSVEVGYD